MTKFKNEHLDSVLKSHSVQLDSGSMLDHYKAKNQVVREALQKEFGSKLVKSINSGSYAKHTAMNRKFDMDICIHFRRDAFKTLKEMYDAVYEFLSKKFKKQTDDLDEVRKQKVSIGLLFSVDGEDIAFDVTPGRKYKDDDTDNNDINIHINDDDIEQNYTKTNIAKQIESILGKNKERECIRLLKVWKFVRKFKIKSFFVELLVIKAFEREAIADITGLWNRLEKTMCFIRDNIETVRLIDPGNSNNIVSDSLSDEEKKALKSQMTTILNKIAADENNIKNYFPQNPKYASETTTETYAKPAATPTILNKATFG